MTVETEALRVMLVDCLHADPEAFFRFEHMDDGQVARVDLHPHLRPTAILAAECMQTVRVVG